MAILIGFMVPCLFLGMFGLIVGVFVWLFSDDKCWHRWSKWKAQRFNTECGGLDGQSRFCEKCNKRQDDI